MQGQDYIHLSLAHTGTNGPLSRSACLSILTFLSEYVWYSFPGTRCSPNLLRQGELDLPLKHTLVHFDPVTWVYLCSWRDFHFPLEASWKITEISELLVSSYSLLNREDSLTRIWIESRMGHKMESVTFISPNSGQNRENVIKAQNLTKKRAVAHPPSRWR